MEKATLLIVSALVLCIFSLHLPWIYTEANVGMGVIVRATASYWSFMRRDTVYRTTTSTPSIDYHLFDQFWTSFSIIPDLGKILGTVVRGWVKDITDGWYIVFLFQILTGLFLSICLAAQEREQDFPVTAQMAINVVTLLVSVGAPVVGANQYIQNWSIAGREFVQFEAGFYLAVVSSILTVIYVVRYFLTVARAPAP